MPDFIKMVQHSTADVPVISTNGVRRNLTLTNEKISRSARNDNRVPECRNANFIKMVQHIKI